MYFCSQDFCTVLVALFDKTVTISFRQQWNFMGTAHL